jgi:hypothetical protein
VIPYFTKLSSIQQLIRENSQSANEGLAKHAATLIGKRSHGSTTTKGIEECNPDIPLFELSRTDGLVIYQFQDESIGGVLGAVPFFYAYKNKWKIVIRDGVHGQELFSPDHPEENTSTDLICVIVGIHEGELAVFTWHPGRPLEPLSKGIQPDTAVKLN